MKFFSKEKFIETEGYDVYLKCKEWVDECDGERVIAGVVEDTDILSDVGWEVECDECYSKRI